MSTYAKTKDIVDLIRQKSAPISTFRREISEDRQQNAVQESTARATGAIDKRVQELSSLSILNGELYSLSFSAPGTITVYHGLKRVPVGVLNTLPTPSAQLVAFPIEATQIWVAASDTKTVQISSSSIVDVKVWVF